MDIILCEINLILFIAYASVNSVLAYRQRKEVKAVKAMVEKGSE